MATGALKLRDMRKTIICLILTLVSLCAYAQQDVTQFLGIPVDGSKSEMIQKLKAKGFRPSQYDKSILEGEFNGRDVELHVVTNGNKVYRIVVADAGHVDENQIHIRFNTLCRQFEKNPKYASFSDQSIPDDEDISREMLIHSKRYQAIFYQHPIEISDTTKLRERIMSVARSKYTQEQLDNPTDEMKADLAEYLLGLYEKKPVWFIINKDMLGRYYIVMYYDNEYNHANGEEL